MKFLVLWHLDAARVTVEVVAAVMGQSAYGKKLEGKARSSAAITWSVATVAPGFTKLTQMKNSTVFWRWRRATILPPTRFCRWPK